MAAGARSSYLWRLAALAVGEAPVLVPRLPNRFAEPGDDTWREEFGEAPPRPVAPPTPTSVEPDVAVRRAEPRRDDQPAVPAALPAAAPPGPSGDATPSHRAEPDRPAVPAIPAEPARLSTATTDPPGTEVRVVHRDEPGAAPRRGPEQATGHPTPAATVRAVAATAPTPAAPTTLRRAAERPYIGPAVDVAARRRPPDPAPVTVHIGRVEVTVSRPAPSPAPASLPERMADGDDSATGPDLSTYLRDPYARGEGARR